LVVVQGVSKALAALERDRRCTAKSKALKAASRILGYPLRSAVSSSRD